MASGMVEIRKTHTNVVGGLRRRIGTSHSRHRPQYATEYLPDPLSRDGNCRSDSGVRGRTSFLDVAAPKCCRSVACTLADPCSGRRCWTDLFLLKAGLDSLRLDDWPLRRGLRQRFAPFPERATPEAV